MYSRALRLTMLLVTLALPRAAAQQVLSLGEAFALADQHAFPNRIARADQAIRTAERDQTLRGLLPSIQAEASWTRTTDPLGAFGALLRQRSVSQTSFSPDLLNNPGAISNLGTGLVVEMPLVNPEVWLGRRAAVSAIRSSDAAAQWGRNQVQLVVLQAYYGGILAREQVTALEAGLAAAQSHVRLAQRLFQQGMVTRSDVLLAEVKTGEVESQLLAARGAEALATLRLALALGIPGDSGFVLPTRLADSIQLMALTAPRTPAPRADVEAARLGAEAASRGVARATARLFPTVNSFGRLDWQTPDALFGGHSAWTVGVMARWSLFGGGGELVERNRAKAAAARAEAEAEAASGQALLEQREYRTGVDVARATLAIADRAVRQAGEAHRIVTRKYEGGLALVTELLEAAAVDLRVQVERAASLYRLIMAVGAWEIAMGYDLTNFTILDQAGRTP